MIAGEPKMKVPVIIETTISGQKHYLKSKFAALQLADIEQVKKHFTKANANKSMNKV